MKKTFLLFLSVITLSSFAQSVPITEKYQGSIKLLQKSFKTIRKNTIKSSEMRLDNIMYKSSESDTYFNRKRAFSYEGDIITEVSSNRGEEPETWLNYSKIQYSYDRNGNITLYIVFEEENGDWVQTDKEIYSYNDNGTPTLEAGYIWDEDNNDWIEINRIDYQYDDQGMLLESYGFILLENLSDRIEMQLMPSGTPENLTITINIKQGEQWVPYGKIDKQYTSNVKLLSDISYNWNGSGWTEDSKEEYDYDANGNVLEYVESDWESNQWIDNYKMTYTYDTNNNILTETEFIDFDSGEGLKEYMQTAYEYDESNKTAKETTYIYGTMEIKYYRK